MRKLENVAGSRALGRVIETLACAFGVAVVVASPPPLRAQSLALAAAAETPLPFHVGEQLTYRVRIPSAWMKGRGVMSVDSSVTIRGVTAYVLHFEFRANLGPVKASSDETSWLDPRQMAVLQFEKRERSPLGKDDQTVEVYPRERRWASADGRAGTSPTSEPLDELSFIYFVRTLPFATDTIYSFDRHFDPERNPVTVRLLRRETIDTPEGPVPTLLVEMRVKDPRHYQGEGIIRINLTDDAARVPVRIESIIPRVGPTIFTLESRSVPAAQERADVR